MNIFLAGFVGKDVDFSLVAGYFVYSGFLLGVFIYGRF